MKKLLSVILAALCIFSVFACTAAAGAFDDILPEEEGGLYCIVYQSEVASQVTMMYVPNPSMSFDGPGYVTVSNDTPIAIDHDFVCWKDGKGHYYKPGEDKIYVNGTVTLYPVWEEKTDNDPHIMRVVKCALASLQRVFQKLFGIFKDFQEFDAEYRETSEVAAP